MDINASQPNYTILYSYYICVDRAAQGKGLETSLVNARDNTTVHKLFRKSKKWLLKRLKTFDYCENFEKYKVTTLLINGSASLNRDVYEKQEDRYKKS